MLAAAGGSITCSVVADDTETLGFPVAVIEHIELGAGDPAPLFRDLRAWCEREKVRFVSCRLDHLRLRESMALEDHEFRFVEMVYRPVLASFDGLLEPDHRISVAEGRAGDLGVLQEIASAAFSTGRLLLDRRLDPALNGRRYANWIRSSMDNPAHQVVKAVLDGQLVGFFVLERRSDDVVYWHLTAVAPGWQGRGIGTSLWRTMLMRHRAEGAAGVETTVSGHNPAVINLYARLGFSFTAPQMTFHWVREPA